MPLRLFKMVEEVAFPVFCFPAFDLTFLTIDLLLGHLHHHLKHVDYLKYRG
jgi:hypothetical protein